MIDFLKYRWIAAIISIAIVGGFFGNYIYQSSVGNEPLKFSVDFTGGTQALFKFSEPTSAEKVISVLSEAGWPGAVTRQFASDEVLVRVQDFSSDSMGLAAKMKSAMEVQLADTTVSVLQSESVGKTIGASLRFKSIQAVLIALLVMLLYIVLRFRSIGFALGAVVALFHDAIAILAVFMFFGLDISVNVIMAILAILGYSINDTIVIFSKIRQNLVSMQKSSLYEVVNTSINQMLRRTILTSLSTCLAIGALLVLGGEALRNLSIALLVGIIFGTYSSIYIACSVMILIYKKKA